MQMKARSWLIALFLSLAMVSVFQPAAAEEEAYVGQPPSAAAMAADVLVVRPLSLAATALGVGIFAISLPFTILGDNVPAAEEQLVLKPGRYTFARPLGEFRDSFSATSSY